MKQYLKLGTPTIAGNRATYQVECSQGVKAYLSDAYFWYESASLPEPAKLPAGILVVPIAGNLATLAWALGADLYIDRLDATYADALTRIQRTFADLYPVLPIRKSHLKVGTLENIEQRAEDSRRIGLLFSGGLDSLSSWIHHRDEVTDLISVWGADVDFDDHALWEGQFLPHLKRNTIAPQAVHHVVRTNVRRAISNQWLTIDFGTRLPERNWWGALQHGLGLTSLTAPIAFQFGITVMMIAASRKIHTRIFDLPWGSMLQIDENVAWTGTTVQHDGYQWTRMEKTLEVLAPYIHENGPFDIAICTKPASAEHAINCGRCDKCVSMAACLLLAGINPNDCGIPNFDSASAEVARQMAAGTYKLAPVKAFWWEDIQSHIPSDLDRVPHICGSHRFFAQLRKVDIDSLVEEDQYTLSLIGPTHPLYIANALGRRLPDRLQVRIKNAMARPAVRKLITGS